MFLKVVKDYCSIKAQQELKWLLRISVKDSTWKTAVLQHPLKQTSKWRAQLPKSLGNFLPKHWLSLHVSLLRVNQAQSCSFRSNWQYTNLPHKLVQHVNLEPSLQQLWATIGEEDQGMFLKQEVISHTGPQMPFCRALLLTTIHDLHNKSTYYHPLRVVHIPLSWLPAKQLLHVQLRCAEFHMIYSEASALKTKI